MDFPPSYFLKWLIYPWKVIDFPESYEFTRGSGSSRIIYNWNDRDCLMISGWWFQPTPLKNMSSSIGMMIFPTEWKHKTCSKPPNRIISWFTNEQWWFSTFISVDQRFWLSGPREAFFQGFRSCINHICLHCLCLLFGCFIGLSIGNYRWT